MTTVDPSIARIAELQQLIVDFAKIQRAYALADTGRKESDVDHSFGLALTCWFMATKLAPKLDIAKILKYALAHDLVEIHSGDTYIFDAEAVKSKPTREAAAIERLASEWPDFPEMVEYIQGYAEKRDAEAKFVYTIDKLIPPLIINLHARDKHWHDKKVTREMHEAEKQAKMHNSPELDGYLAALNEYMRDPDYFYKAEAE